MQPFTIFIPVYNEADILEANVEKVISTARGLQTPFQLLLADNGSTDATPQLAQRLARRHGEIESFRLPRRGPGAALRRGLELTRYDWIVTLDMDLSADLKFIAEALVLLETHDLVIGSKKTGSESRSFTRRACSDLFILMSRLLLRLPFDDYSLGAKAYRKSFLLRYRGAIDDGTAYVQTLACLAHRDACPAIEISVDCQDHRRSKFNLLHEGLYRFSRLFKLWIQGAPDLAP
ncbi:MAG TPA: glycosyl transferase family 2 [Elusimicrobia bacterium]|nr:glycosyl transferase family 2 [Elusimicrobiota bacterium]HBT60224.1 glycosyl transferase family 2 [Elusimicrobiota bacterium]